MFVVHTSNFYKFAENKIGFMVNLHKSLIVRKKSVTLLQVNLLFLSKVKWGNVVIKSGIF